MKNILTILTVICAITYAAEAQKLQIGVKKRVENCTQKAKKGDLVHIHYTVNISKYLVVPKTTLISFWWIVCDGFRVI